MNAVLLGAHAAPQLMVDTYRLLWTSVKTCAIHWDKVFGKMSSEHHLLYYHWFEIVFHPNCQHLLDSLRQVARTIGSASLSLPLFCLSASMHWSLQPAFEQALGIINETDVYTLHENKTNRRNKLDYNHQHSVIIQNLPYDFKETKLKDLLINYGEVQHIDLHKVHDPYPHLTAPSLSLLPEYMHYAKFMELENIPNIKNLV